MIPFTDYGGDGNTVHFLHANGYPPDCYMPLVECLSGNYHVQAMHLRPLWPASDPKQLLDWTPLTQDFLTYIDENNYKPVLAVGHSVGAILALRAAIQNPEYFRALILIDPVLFSPNFIFLWKIIKALGLGHKFHPLIPGSLRRRRTFDNLELVFRSYRRRKIFQYFDDKSLWSYIIGITIQNEDGSYRLKYSPEWEAQIYFSGVWKDMDIWHNLSTFKVPTLIIRGSDTDTFVPEVARRVQRICPPIRIATINNATHLVPLEKPEETFGLINNFLKEIL